MYKLMEKPENGQWKTIWTTRNGQECLEYLTRCVQAEPKIEYKMTFVLEKKVESITK